MADNMTLPIVTYIAMHKFFIAIAKSCRIRLVEPEKSGQAAAFLRARLAVPAFRILWLAASQCRARRSLFGATMGIVRGQTPFPRYWSGVRP